MITLHDGATVYSTGCYLKYDAKTNRFLFNNSDEDMYYDGKIVNYTDNEFPYIENDEA